MSTESYSIEYSPESANVPHWLIFRNELSYPARMLAIAVLAHQQAGSEPTRELLAADFGVTERTIDRQLDELRAAKLLGTHRTTRQHQYSVLTPRKPLESTHGSTLIHVSNLDTWINVDKAINVDPCVYIDSPHPKAVNRNRVDPCVDSAPVGVGVGHDLLKESEPTISNRAPLKTPIARWLKQAGMNAARHFDDTALDYWTYRRFVENKRGLGWEWRQIVSTLREAPLERDPLATPVEDRAILEKARQLDQADIDYTADARVEHLSWEEDDRVEELAEAELAARKAERETAWQARQRQEIIESVNRRPHSYHGGSK